MVIQGGKLSQSQLELKDYEAHRRPERDDILVLALMFAPMTGLRVWKIGPAETLALLWALPFLPRRRLKSNAFVRFFALFLGSMLFGSLICIMVAREEFRASGLIIWFYLMLISIGLYRGLSGNTVARNEQLLERFTSVCAVWNILLYLFALVGPRTFLGAPLWYHYRYSGGGTNPHQIALMLACLIPLLLRNVIIQRRQLWSLVLAVGLLPVLRATNSSTAIMAAAAGVGVALISWINSRSSGRRYHSMLIVVEILVGLVVLVVFYRFFYQRFYNWIASDNNGLGRFELFSHIGKTFRTSPIFGLGPGGHTRTQNGTVTEYHNSYLEILAASGLVGAFALVLFTIRLLRQLKGDLTFLPTIVTMYTYGFAGFGMRRLIYWGLIVFIYVIAEQRSADQLGRLNGTVPPPDTR